MFVVLLMELCCAGVLLLGHFAVFCFLLGVSLRVQ